LTAKRELRSQALPKIPVQRQAVVFEPIALCPVDFFVLRILQHFGDDRLQNVSF